MSEQGERPCERCGKPINGTWRYPETVVRDERVWVVPGRRMRDRTRFCSAECRVAASREAAPARPRTCAQCGAPLEIKRYGRVAAYCSGRCRMRALRARNSAEPADSLRHPEPDLGGLTRPLLPS